MFFVFGWGCHQFNAHFSNFLRDSLILGKLIEKSLRLCRLCDRLLVRLFLKGLSHVISLIMRDKDSPSSQRSVSMTVCSFSTSASAALAFGDDWLEEVEVVAMERVETDCRSVDSRFVNVSYAA
jgi:hypothetical protein